MVCFRRNFLPGAGYFFSVALLSRTSSLLLDCVPIVHYLFCGVQAQALFTLNSIIILLEHFYCKATLSSGDKDYRWRWCAIKIRLTRQIPAGKWRCNGRTIKKERGIWRRQYWAHGVRSAWNRVRHLNYLPFKPMKHRNFSSAVQWRYSLFHPFVRDSVYPADWRGATGNGGSGE